jgi:UTP:GlnB (protein PII) uridylyltransferase
VSRDQSGLLARIARALADLQLDVVSASAAVWGDRVAVDTVSVRSTSRPSARLISERIESALRGPVPEGSIISASVRFDNDSNPWHTVCTVEADDVPGVLAAICAAVTSAGAEVHSARIASRAGVVLDRFELTDRTGRKLDANAQSRLRQRLGVRTNALPSGNTA